ncbi:unnamed protein product, partial [Prorocentrum cordatum]
GVASLRRPFGMGNNFARCKENFGDSDSEEIFQSRYTSGWFPQALGSGSCSKAYRCWKRGSSRGYAMKAFESNEGASAHAVNEIKVLDALGKHPRITHMIEYDMKDLMAVRVVLELCEGGQLFDRIRARGYYEEPKAAVVVRQVLEAVAFLHSKGVMHRDMKPENVLLVSRDSDTDVKVCDFGLAKMAPISLQNPRGPRSVSFRGSDHYLAPEIIRQEDALVRSSLGHQQWFFRGPVTEDPPSVKTSIFQRRSVAHTLSQAAGEVEFLQPPQALSLLVPPTPPLSPADAKPLFSHIPKNGGRRGVIRGAAQAHSQLARWLLCADTCEHFAAAVVRAKQLCILGSALGAAIRASAVRPPPAASRTDGLVLFAAIDADARRLPGMECPARDLEGRGPFDAETGARDIIARAQRPRLPARPGADGSALDNRQSKSSRRSDDREHLCAPVDFKFSNARIGRRSSADAPSSSQRRRGSPRAFLDVAGTLAAPRQKFFEVLEFNSMFCAAGANDGDPPCVSRAGFAARTALLRGDEANGFSGFSSREDGRGRRRCPRCLFGRASLQRSLAGRLESARSSQRRGARLDQTRPCVPEHAGARLRGGGGRLHRCRELLRNPIGADGVADVIDVRARARASCWTFAALVSQLETRAPKSPQVSRHSRKRGVDYFDSKSMLSCVTKVPCTGEHVPVGLAVRLGCAPASYRPGQHMFAVLRHPYTRAVSQWSWGADLWNKTLGYELTAIGMNKFIQDSIANSSVATDSFLTCWAGGQPWRSNCGRFIQDCHWLPQADYIFDIDHRQPLVTTLLNQTNLAEELRTLLGEPSNETFKVAMNSELVNDMEDGTTTSGFQSWVCALTEQTKQVLDAHYAIDFEKFGPGGRGSRGRPVRWMAHAGAQPLPSWLAEVDSVWLEDFAPAVREHISDAAANVVQDWTQPTEKDETRETWLYVIDMLAARVDLFSRPHTDWPVQMHLLHVVCFHDSMGEADLQRLAGLVEAGAVLRGGQSNDVLRAAPVAEVVARLQRAAGDLACLLRLRAVLLRACSGSIATLEDLQDAIDGACEGTRRARAGARAPAAEAAGTAELALRAERALEDFARQVLRITWQSDGPGLGSQGLDPLPPAELGGGRHLCAALKATEASFPSALLQHAAKRVGHLVATARHLIFPQLFSEPLERARDLNVIKELFLAVDVDRSGSIEYQEFVKCMNKPECFRIMNQRFGLQRHQSKIMFTALDVDGDGCVTLNEWFDTLKTFMDSGVPSVLAHRRVKEIRDLRDQACQGKFDQRGRTP